MSEYTDREIEGFARAANLDLGANKYKASDVIADYAKAIVIIQQLMADLKRKAAPDMYEALKAITATDDFKDWDEIFANQANQALAKARGE